MTDQTHAEPDVAMSDAPADAEAQIDQVVKEVKRGFSLKDRLAKRGLRKVSVTLFLDENTGAQHRDLVEKIEPLEAEIAELDQMITMTENATVRENALAKIGPLKSERENLLNDKNALEESLWADSLVVKLQAVPQIIAKDCHRRAKVTAGIEGKDIPDDKREEYVSAFNAHLLSVTAQQVVDTVTGDTNDALSYEDAVDLFNLLPQGQAARLAGALNEVQFRDAFSQSIEKQEDFS